ncbi:conserved hypothetical protein [Talaromyces stipitatus ATCC 10500]|uniref:Gryzun putative trafficking through Golgi domain-containing protein n=1 Tax=Talaromyces stipitatus (strain ATCC 10500 / CBS 375.48 / QM 6759 / NRRL 1006) TaxID=441959 RepID=B8M738_TALSN|nr:uncharacterized protein TSTA_034890 [Talaromyces stipitatus ATCC 10500]EED20258.1 conserved hypothetical protein [Talaromyces stipitatus ATCC 10500]
MDAYPNDYIVHNLPLILLSGIAHDEAASRPEYPSLQQRGTAIESDFPLLTGPLVDILRSAFIDHDASEAAWRPPTDTGKFNGSPLRIKTIGRSYRLPPQKAEFPSDADFSSSSVVPVVHSPISPLTPGSPTFPDGILTPLWMLKHQDLVPAATINVFPLTSDPSMSTLRDNQLKIELRDLKESWAASGYRSRFVVILVAEDGISSQDIEDRLANIRRATNLDPRSLHVLNADLSPVEVKDFVRSFLSSIQASLVDYYRDLSKHARRKRNRGTIPPPTVPPTQGTSQTLSTQGWNVRYEFKLGVFAEFRQEMEAAQRNFEAAYETLFGQEVFESIAGWSPRFNEARLLGDVLAIRIIRCLLWTSQPTAAVRFWLNHKSNTEDIVNRRGKGTKNYGWEAWVARWSMVMAQLISRAELPAFSAEFLQNPARLYDSIFHPPEKGTSSDGNLLPWEYLHHQGYWLDRSARHTVRRRQLAEQIPEEHRVAIDQVPASQAVAQSQFYDTYLAPEPAVEAPNPEGSGFDHNTLILQTLKAALQHFAARDQVRKVESLSLEIAQFHIIAKQWQEAYDILKPLWPHLTWRKGHWWDLMGEFAWALRSCALELHDIDTLFWVHWELLSKALPLRPDWDYNLHRCLDGVSVGSPKPTIVLKAEDVLTCLSASMVFQKGEGNVGQALQLQMAITSHAHQHAAPLKLSQVKVIFEGGLRPITIQADDATGKPNSSSSQIFDIKLRDSAHSTESSTLLSPTGHVSSMIGQADLTFRPSEARVFNMTAIPRESGESRIASITIAIEEEKFNLLYVITNHEQGMSFWWRDGLRGPSKKRIGKGRDTTACKILPKPPNIQIQLPDLKPHYYTSERVSLTVAIQNNEDDAAEVAMQIRVRGQPDSPLKISWSDDADETTEFDGVSVESTNHLKSRSVGTLSPAAISEIPIILSNTADALEYEVEISVNYFLVSDPETPISKSISATLVFIRPFEANYDFLPRINPNAWPNLFHLNTDSDGDKPDGLQQRWCVSPKIVSFASEPLVIQKVNVGLLEIHGGAICDIGPEKLTTPEAKQILPEELRTSEFILNVQKISLDDRRSVALDLSLNIEWRRPSSADGDEEIITTATSLAMPRFMIPMGEPRVLASASASKELPGLIHLDYTLENPSMHTLTFSLTMDASEHFAFSGAKTRALQLVPLSRHTVRYNIFAFRSGMWIQPHLVVVDTYFNKTLRVLPTEGMRADKKGILVWVDAYES